MKRTIWTRAAAVVFTLALVLVMTGLPNVALATVDTVEITTTSSTTLRVGDQITLNSSINAVTLNPLNSPVYSWTPTAAGVISMSPTNAASTVVTGRTSGSQTVTLAVHDADTATDVTDTIDITVSPMTIAFSSVTLAPGTSSSSLSPGNFTGSVAYSTSNANIATVNSSGVITAVASGTATITVTNTPSNSAPQQTQTCVVTVPTVTLSPSNQTLTTGSATTTLTLAITNGGSVIDDGDTVNWSTSNGSIGSLSSPTSTVSGGSATINFTSSAAATNGSTTITATVGGYSRTATITVTTVKYLDIQGPSDLNKTTRTGTFTVYLKNPDGTVYDDDTSTVHWSWSSSYLSLTSDSINNNRAHMHNGEAHIQLYAKYNTPSGGTKLYAWINSDTGGKVYHTINISGLSSLPQTGQNMTLVYLFGGLSAALLAAAGVWYGIRKKHSAV